MADLFIDVLRSLMRAGTFNVHEFTVMPNHVHILLAAPPALTVERAMQLVKGGFSFRARKDLGFSGEIWQRGFSEVRVDDDQCFKNHQEYIAQNPVKAGLADSPEEYPFGSVRLKALKRAGAKAQSEESRDGTTKVVP
jgi:putative transposase